MKYLWLDRKYLLRKWLDNLAWYLAGKVPNAVKMRVFMLIVAKATCGKYEETVIGELPAMEAIKRWESEVGYRQ